MVYFSGSRYPLSLEHPTIANQTTLRFSKVRLTFKSSFDDATEAFVPDDLVEAITNGRKSDVDVDTRSCLIQHLST